MGERWMRSEGPGRVDDRGFMARALAEAQKALQLGEVPIGALVVNAQGEILARAHNLVEQMHSQTEHAEACAIRLAGAYTGDWRLAGCTLYVTLEPCMMCISLAALSRIERVVFGAQSPLFGYHLDIEGVLALYTKQIKNITPGICAEEALKLLQDFFNAKRASNERKN